MTSQTRATLYTYFETGDVPSQQQFANLIDSCLNLTTTSAQSITSTIDFINDVTVSGNINASKAIVVGVPTGGNKGIGTVNATGIYVNGTLITTTSAGGSGTVTAGVSGQIAYYNANSNTVAGISNLPDLITATTRAVNTSNTQLATTAFVNPASTISANGYVKLANGTIIQWGSISAVVDGSDTSVSFPLTFPNNVYAISGFQTSSNRVAEASIGGWCLNNSTLTTSGFIVHNASTGTNTWSWLAIGN